MTEVKNTNQPLGVFLFQICYNYCCCVFGIKIMKTVDLCSLVDQCALQVTEIGLQNTGSTADKNGNKFFSLAGSPYLVFLPVSNFMTKCNY